MKSWIADYVSLQQKAVGSISQEKVNLFIQRLHRALENNQQIFVCGNGGSASNASHFATDLGKSASDKMGKRFRVLSLNDNVSWMTALGNDQAFENIFSGQLMNYASPGDLLIVLSVSGSSPNIVKAVEWAKSHGITTLALLGGKKGKVAAIADESIIIDSEHYGRVEDAQMTICHMLCYAFIEGQSPA